MSIFMAVKYPISLPPTAGQLEAIPHVIYQQWFDEIIDPDGQTSSRLTPQMMAKVMARCGTEDIQTAIDRLRCIIYCLDEE